MDIRKDLESLLNASCFLAPPSLDGVVLNPTPHMSYLMMRCLKGALEGFKPESDLELEFYSALLDIFRRGGYSETEEENRNVRRMERDIYLSLGFEADKLAKFYKDLEEV